MDTKEWTIQDRTSAQYGIVSGMDIVCGNNIICRLPDGAGRKGAFAWPKQLENAKLIASAPRLVDTLRRMLKMYDMMMGKIDHGASWYDGETLQEMNEAPLQTRALLAELD